MNTQSSTLTALHCYNQTTSTLIAPEETFPSSHIKFNEETTQRFGKYCIEALRKINTPQLLREIKQYSATIYEQNPYNEKWLERTVTKNVPVGVHFVTDFTKHWRDEDTPNDKMLWLGPTSHFLNTKEYNSSKDSAHAPHHTIKSFFSGPSYADCGSGLNACMHYALNQLLGDPLFNELYNAPFCAVHITRYLFEPPTNINNQCNNHLFFLFDANHSSDEQPIKEKNIKLGDIVYIKGVDSYGLKHAFGQMTGFNVICAGKDANGMNTYLGFSPQSMQKPLTKQQISDLLIKDYNKPQSDITIEMAQQETNPAKHFAYKELANHTVPLNYETQILATLRFNPQKLEQALKSKDRAWPNMTLPNPASTIPPRKKASATLNFASPFSRENQNSTLSNFTATTAQQVKMLETAQKFSLAVIANMNNKPKDQHPLGLFLTGSAGIGKTHLATGIAKEVARNNGDVIYFSESFVTEVIQRLSGGFDAFKAECKQQLNNCDLVVIDDINSNFGVGKTLIDLAIERALANDTAIAVTSNQKINLTKNFSGFIPLETRHNFVYLSDLQEVSQRQHWASTESNYPSLSSLAKHHKNTAAGIILEDTYRPENIAFELNINASKIRTVGHYFLPNQEKISADYYFNTDLSNYEAVLLTISVDKSEFPGNCKFEQLLHVVSTTHDSGKKLVVCTNNKALLIEKTTALLQHRRMQNTRPRHTDRLKQMFVDFASISV